jgi:NitT/TauT family transport system substrate-binding protein
MGKNTTVGPSPDVEKNQVLQPFHLTATGYNLNYLPEYIALRHGFFKEQGLDVSVNIPVPWDGVLDALHDNTAIMALGGIWVPSMYRDRVEHYTVFAQIANRCPLAILKRGSSEGFKLTDMAKSTVLMKSGGGASVGLFFKMLLRENGIDARGVDYVQDLDGIMLGNLFQGGMGDYFITDNLSALAMVARNPKVSIAMECVTQGDIPWSVYYRETETITPEILDAQKQFCIGLEKGIEWVMKHEAESFRDELAELFPTVPVDVAVNVTNDFRRNQMWTTTSVDRNGFQRWQRGLTDAGLLSAPLPYEAIVDDAPAAAARVVE